MADLAVNLCGTRLRNPIVAAAGTCGYVIELPDVLDPACLGAAVTKSITREPRDGNPRVRVAEVAAGMLNSIGLWNVGLDRFLAEKLPLARRLDTVLIGSIAGTSIDDSRAVAAAFDAEDCLPIVELNVSCPNTADGLVFGEDPRALRDLLAQVRPALSRTKLIVKLTPNVTDVAAVAEAAVEGGADGLTLINTVIATAIDVETRSFRLGAPEGGLSGPAIHPIAVRMVREVHTRVAGPAGVPIIGLGGVLTWRDAAELILAGASAVGMGTALFVDPRLVKRVVRGLDKWVERQGCRAVGELVGQVRA